MLNTITVEAGTSTINFVCIGKTRTATGQSLSVRSTVLKML